MGSFVQAGYVHWRIVGECPVHKNTLVVVRLFVKASCEVVVVQLFLSYSVSHQCLDFYLEGLAFRLFLVENI